MKFFKGKYGKYIEFTLVGLVIIVLYNQIQRTPKPFEAISNTPDGEFLFLFIDDNDHICLMGFCECPISEAPVRPFDFNGETLILNQYYFEPIPDNWVSYREENNSIALFGYHSQWDAYLQLFSRVPFETIKESFSVLGVNSKGNVQIKRDKKYVVIPDGSYRAWTKFEIRSSDCIVLHYYTLTNYGFIQDNNVSFYP